HFAHRLGGYSLFAAGLLFVAWIWRAYAGRPRVLVPATAFGLLLIVQVGLGVMTVMTGEHALMATSHQTVGALLLASAMWLAIRMHLLPVPGQREDHVPVAAGDATTERLRTPRGPASEPTSLPKRRPERALERRRPEPVNA
ncbi:MAG: COX15/CtaA family protein, partial [Planctomycetota bacterium]